MTKKQPMTFELLPSTGAAGGRDAHWADAITAAKQLAMPVVATGVVVDAIAIANGEAVPSAIPPDRVLHGRRDRLGRARGRPGRGAPHLPAALPNKAL